MCRMMGPFGSHDSPDENIFIQQALWITAVKKNVGRIPRDDLDSRKPIGVLSCVDRVELVFLIDQAHWGVVVGVEAIVT